MYLHCFICKQTFADFKKMTCHLKYFHNLPPNSSYECVFINCKQKFSNFKSFSKHVRNELYKTNNNHTNETINTENDVFELENNILEPNCIYENHDEEPSNIENNISEIQNLTFEEDNISRDIAPFNLSQTLSPLLTNSFKLALSNFSFNRFSRKDATTIQNNVKKNITGPIANELKSILNDFKTNDSLNIKNKVENIISFCENPFEGFDTEYKFLKTLKDINLYESPSVIQLNNTISNIVLSHVNTMDEVITKGVLFPIKFHIKKFFEIPGMYEEFRKTMDIINNSRSLNHFCNGKIWKNKVKKYTDKFVIPYFLYFDDFEVNNPLGSHSSSLLGVYFSFPSAPEHLKFTLKNIFIAALFKSKDVKDFGNDKCFFKLTEILNDLESNGVEIVTKSGKYKLYFCLGLIVGDNLALNNILGFSRSFSSKFFCRLCKIDRSHSKVNGEEDSNKIRNLENYNEDIQLNNYENTGIRENSIFNKINNYHVVENLYADVLHDVLEGVLKYDFCHIILYFVNNKIFDLELFNIRKQNFNYGEQDIGNKSPKIEMHHLKSFNLKMSGSEMLTFAHFFPLFIGDLVDVNSDIWKFVINLVELIDLLMLTDYSSLDIINLKSHIDYHNKEYITLFEDSLKPKHHFLSHYCRILEHSGPFAYLWTFNFESKHRQLKSYVKNINSRRNVVLSLAIKFCISFSELVLNFEKNTFVMGNKRYNVKESTFYNILLNYIKEDEIEKCTCFNSFERYGTLYKNNFIIYSYDPNFSASKIQEIYEINGKIFLLCQTIHVLSYVKSLSSYLISSEIQEFKTISVSSIKSPPIHIHELNNKFYLRPKNTW